MNNRLSALLLSVCGAALLVFHADMKEWPAAGALAEGPRPTAPRTRAGRPARAFSLPLLNGGVFSLSAYKGRVVVLNFFATWCGPCREELPELARFARAHKDEAVFLAVDAGETADKVAAFAAAQDMPFPVALDLAGEVQRLYDVQAYPTTVVIGKDGRILAYTAGAIRSADVSLAPFLDGKKK